MRNARRSKASRNHGCSFGNLPNELIIKILTLCGPKEIVQCRAVCRKLRTIVDKANEVQYTLELGVAGVEDMSEETYQTYPIPERLRDIRALQESWKQYQTISDLVDEDFPLQPTSFDGDDIYVGNVVIGAHRLDEEDDEFNTLDCLCISASRLHPEAKATLKEWAITFDFSFKYFMADPAQDLLVLLELPGIQYGDPLSLDDDVTCQCCVHFVRLTDGSRLSPPSVPFLLPISYTEYPVKIALHGDVVAVISAERRYRYITKPTGMCVRLINWRTGCLISSWQSLGDDIRGLCAASAFALPSDSCFLVGTSLSVTDGRCLAIEVYKYDKHASSPLDPIHAATFKLPYLQRNVEITRNVVFEFSVSGEYSGSVQKAAFVPIPGCAMLYIDNISMSSTARRHRERTLSCTISMAIQLSTLLESIDTYDKQQHHTKTPLTYPWDIWGPRSTRCLPYSDPRNNKGVHGSRIYHNDYILDFNKLDIARDLNTIGAALPRPTNSYKSRRELKRHVRSSDNAVGGRIALPQYPGIIVIEKTIISHDCFFKEDVVSYLPYRKVPMNLPLWFDDEGEISGGSLWVARSWTMQDHVVTCEYAHIMPYIDHDSGSDSASSDGDDSN